VPSDAPLVDVTIPTLGESPFLVEAIDSVARQTHFNWRLLVSENGPGCTEVARVLEPYGDDLRVEHVVTGTLLDRGQHYTRLIRWGSAPYVCLLHDDDRWQPTFLSTRVVFLERNASCGLVFSDYAVVDDDGVFVARTRLPLKEGVHRSIDMLPKLYRRMIVASPTVMVRRRAYETLDASFKDIRFSDHEMWLRIAAHFDIGYVDVCDADYRFHLRQTSSRRVREGEETLRVLDAADDLPVPRRVRGSARAEAHVWCSFDAIEESDRRRAFSHLVKALGSNRLFFMQPSTALRIVVAVAALLTGRLGRSALTSVRDRRWSGRRKRGISFTTSMTR
jgi:hypothetical protein